LAPPLSTGNSLIDVASTDSTQGHLEPAQSSRRALVEEMLVDVDLEAAITVHKAQVIVVVTNNGQVNYLRSTQLSHKHKHK